MLVCEQRALRASYSCSVVLLSALRFHFRRTSFGDTQKPCLLHAIVNNKAIRTHEEGKQEEQSAREERGA